MILTAQIYKANTPNANGLIYPKEELEIAVEEFNKKEQLVQVLDGYNGAFVPIDLTKIAGKATLKMEDDVVVATIKLIGTPMGKRVKRIIETTKDNITIQCLPEAQGTINDNVISELSIQKIILSKDVDTGSNAHLFIVKVQEDEKSN